MIAAASLVLALTMGAVGPVDVTSALPLRRAVCWTAPVIAPVADPFREPPCRWCPGNRGIEYGVVPGQTVVAAVAGTVSFAGVVAGQAFVTVDIGGGLRVTYGRLGNVGVGAGQQVAAGSVIGTTSETFILTLRDGDRYLDPGPLIGVRRARPHLIPTDGSPRRAAPPVRITCSAPV